jgi:hypothetical protein
VPIQRRKSPLGLMTDFVAFQHYKQFDHLVKRLSLWRLHPLTVLLANSKVTSRHYKRLFNVFMNASNPLRKALINKIFALRL